MFFKSSNNLNQEKIITVLKNVFDPISGKDVITANIISDITIKEGNVSFIINSTTQALQPACEQAIQQLDEVQKVTAVLTSEKTDNSTNIPKNPAARANWNLTKLDNVKKIIVIASGKGGVGKSTTAVCLAHAAKERGLNVGILDADIYGSSLPNMMSISEKPEFVDNQMIPLEKYGIKLMSMGFLIGTQAAVMRAPMITKALSQMLRGTKWADSENPLDILFIDMPPGTGDVHLSLVQQVPISADGGGAIIVTTPQEVALSDARKCAEMFQKTNVPILGIIENMSHFKDPESGNISNIFGEGGGEKLAGELSSELLAKIPLDIALRTAMDEGQTPDLTEYENINL